MKQAVFVLLLFVCIVAQSQQKTNSNNNPPALNAIQEADLKRDLYAMASDIKIPVAINKVIRLSAFRDVVYY